LELTDAARTHLQRAGFDPAYGARPLKRAIQREIESPLARLILAGEVRDGQTIEVDVESSGAGLKFESGRAVHV
jgi:ATP-dependent Clp protease ATP-binding subunit ClpB